MSAEFDNPERIVDLWIQINETPFKKQGSGIPLQLARNRIDFRTASVSLFWEPMRGPNYIHCITGEINAVLVQMKLSTRYTSNQRFYKEIPMVVCLFLC